MSCLCIGGVCIPYTALLPMLIIGLQWMASQLAKIGLLPDFIAKRLGLLAAAAKPGCDDAGCCGSSPTTSGGGDGSRQPRRRGKRSDTVATTSSSSSSFSASDTDGRTGGDETTVDFVEHVTDLSRYQEIITASACCTSNNNNNSTLIVKFTAEWCKPCKSIQPAFRSLASKYSPTTNRTTSSATATTFITVDVDGDECDTLCTQYKIIMMPTFICLRNGKEVGRMTGGGEENGKKLVDWVNEMVCS